ncbi:MAG TPA: ABC transporter permease [Actinomycetota bacterium]|nr:ABC transporter permease [Actinomycetota bacterium]
MSVRFVGLKVLGALATLFFVVVFNFFLFRVVESDPVGTLVRGRNLTEEQQARLAADFGVDQPLPEQFRRYLAETAQLNLGLSFETREPVWDVIKDKAWATVFLVGTAAVLSAVIGTLLGIFAAWRRGSAFDYASTSGTMLLYSMPDFWLGLLLLVVFADQLGWFPTGGLTDAGSDASGLSGLLDQAHHMALPGLTLMLAYLGEYAIIMRSSVLETMGEDYLVLARAKGLRDALVRRRHAVPNALLPLVTLIAINFGFVLSGAIAVEAIFSWPGLGLATANAIRAPDLPMLQVLFLVFSAAVIFANLAADLLYAYLDPRVRT